MKDNALFTVYKIILVLIGLYALISNGAYFLSTLFDLADQGISGWYLVLMTVLSSWWLGLSVALCFVGLALEPTDKKWRGALYSAILGAVEFVVPGLMLVGWFIAVVFIYSLFS